MNKDEVRERALVEAVNDRVSSALLDAASEVTTRYSTPSASHPSSCAAVLSCSPTPVDPSTHPPCTGNLGIIIVFGEPVNTNEFLIILCFPHYS